MNEAVLELTPKCDSRPVLRDTKWSRTESTHVGQQEYVIEQKAKPIL
jgi:hypothetical protein